MTTTHIPVPTPTTVAALARVRAVLRADALLCLATGALLVVAASPLTDLAGVDTTAPTIAAGAFLLALGAGLAVLARAGARPLLALVPWSAEGDLAWAAGSLAVAVLVDLTGPGRALVIGQAAVVAAIGIVKLRLIRRAR